MSKSYKMFDKNLPEKEQEAAIDSYIIGCLLCAKKHYDAIACFEKAAKVEKAARFIEARQVIREREAV
jgi:hypothetical protein